MAITFVLMGLAPGAAAAPPEAWAGAEAVAVVPDAAFPTDLGVASDGSVWFTELKGNVSRHDPATGTTERIHHVEDVITGTERGLVGLALAHDHEETGAFYLYYSQRSDAHETGMNRFVRIEDGEETLLATLTAAPEHNGGRIVVAPNGTVFVGTGENSLHDPAQDLDSLLGKILRMTPDGEPVDGNLKGLVYSYGHRNVYGLARDPDTGELWAAENMGWRRDEVNLIEAGGNYGYPECEGHGLHGVDEPCPTDKGYVFPVMTFYEDRAAAPTSVTFWQDGLYWSSFNEGAIHHMWQDEATGTWNDTVVYDHEQPILDLHAASDGTFWFSAMDGVFRIAFAGDEGAGADPTPGGTDGGGSPGTDGAPTGTVPAPSMTLVLMLCVSMVLWAHGRRRRGR